MCMLCVDLGVKPGMATVKETGGGCCPALHALCCAVHALLERPRDAALPGLNPIPAIQFHPSAAAGVQTDHR